MFLQILPRNIKLMLIFCNFFLPINSAIVRHNCESENHIVFQKWVGNATIGRPGLTWSHHLSLFLFWPFFACCVFFLFVCLAFCFLCLLFPAFWSSLLAADNSLCCTFIASSGHFCSIVNIAVQISACSPNLIISSCFKLYFVSALATLYWYTCRLYKYTSGVGNSISIIQSLASHFFSTDTFIQCRQWTLVPQEISQPSRISWWL